MQWETIHGNTGAIATRFALIPYYRLSDHEIVLMDSGAEKDPELPAELERRQLRPVAVLCTHLHPDHIANNRELVSRFGTEIFAAPEELLEVHQRFENLRRSDPENAWVELDPDYPITPLSHGGVTIGGAFFEILPTPGHTSGHLAIVTPDRVCCVGDAMMSDPAIRHAKLPYMDDVEQSIESMERLRQTDCVCYAAAHRGVTAREDLPQVLDLNIRKEIGLYDLLRGCITEPMEKGRAVDAFMSAAGMRSQAMRVSYFMRYTAEIRVDALIHAGEFRLENGWVIPDRKGSL